MTPQSTVTELLARLGARDGARIFVSDEELSRWPAAAVAALKSQRLLVTARPAGSAICPGCEQACVMPVHSPRRADGAAAAFIVCDKRSDINRVALPHGQLTQWRCDAEAMCAFIAGSLGIRRDDRAPADGKLLTVGVARGDKRSQVVCLRSGENLTLVVGNQALLLADVIFFRDGEYAVDHAAIRELVDSATTADARYTPSNVRREARKLDTRMMYGGWQKAYRDLRRRRPNMSGVWYSQQIAKMTIAQGRNADTIRKHLKV
jgi:hypothetical protein